MILAIHIADSHMQHCTSTYMTLYTNITIQYPPYYNEVHSSCTLASSSVVKNGGSGDGVPVLVSHEKLSIADGTYIKEKRLHVKLN